MTSPFSVQDSVSKKKRTGVVELTSWNMSLVSLKLTLIHFHVPMIFPWHSHYIPIIFRWYCHDSFPWWYSPRYSGDIPMIFPWYFHDMPVFKSGISPYLTVELPRWPYFSASGLILWPQTIWGEPPMPWPRATSTRHISMGFLWPIWFHRNSMGLHGVSMGFKRGSMRFHGGSIGLIGISTGLSGIL